MQTRSAAKRKANDEQDQTRSTKKPKLEEGPTNFLSLPSDVLLRICSYITVIEDIFRFEIACKKIRSLTFKMPLELNISEEESFKFVESILSRDLQCMSKLTLFSPRDLTDAQNTWIAGKMTMLSNLTNLKKLQLNFDYRGNKQRKWIKRFSALRATLKKMTWLESLSYQYPIISDLAEVFSAHSKLTKLEVRGLTDVPYNATGYSKLTQLKSLFLPMSTTDQIFKQIINLTNLTALQMNLALKVASRVAQNLTRLTNLEKVGYTCLPIPGTILPWRVFKSLPKLSKLREGFYGITQPEQYNALYHLTGLTCLDLGCGMDPPPLPIEKLANLTKLEALSIGDPLNSTEFAKFSNVTRLQFGEMEITAFQRVSFPVGLKSLDILPIVDRRIFHEIVNIASLETLTLANIGEDLTPSDTTQISRLTRLRDLQLYGYIPKGLGNGLKELPYLRKLGLALMDGPLDLDELRSLTQLNHMEIRGIEDPNIKLAKLRAELPFIVYLIPSLDQPLLSRSQSQSEPESDYQ